MSAPWLIAKSVLTSSVLGLIIVGSYLVSTHPPPSLAVTVVTIVESKSTCNRTDCSGHGECEMQEGSNSTLEYACTCDKWNYGSLCEEECPSLCSQVGVCKTYNDTTNLTSMFLDQSGNVSCQCPRNYVGAGCEVYCNCSANGVCQEDGSCACERGFSGDRCEISCGDCGAGWCTNAGTCQCDLMHYGARCNLTREECHSVVIVDVGDSEPVSRGEESEAGPNYIKGVFTPDCALNSTIQYNFNFTPALGRCVGSVRIFNVNNTFIESYGQDCSTQTPKGSEGVIYFDYNMETIGYPFIRFQNRYSAELPQRFELVASCSQFIEKERCLVGTKCVSTDSGGPLHPPISSVLYQRDSSSFTLAPSPFSFTHFDGSWTPAAPRANVLARESYYRPDLISASSTNAFSLGLGWLTIVVSILCCVTFLVLCFRPPRSKELSSMNTEGRFRDVLVREMRSRHAFVGLCNASADSVLNLPAKFLLLFLSTFFNLALSALWFGQHSVGEMFSSTLITASCTFVLMQLMRLCLREAHIKNKWYIPLISYTGPLVLAVWSAYTTGLFVLQMSETEAQFFLLRAVCSFILQHTIFFLVTTTVIVWIGQRKKAKRNSVAMQPLPEC